MSPAHYSSSDALSRYLSRLRNTSRLTREEELELVQNIENGRRNALDKLIESNLTFVVKVASEYRGLGLPFEDLLNEGNIGLIQAARRFDPDRNTRFLTYAVWWIRKSILKAITDHASLVRVPSYKMKRVQEILEAEASLRRELGRKPRREEISARLHRKLPKIDELLQIRRRSVSLDEQVGERGDLSLADLLEDTASVSAEQKLLLEEARNHLNKSLALLSEQERFVMTYRFGLKGKPSLTLQQIGLKMGLSRERIRQIESRARGQLRKYFKKNLIHSPYRGRAASLRMSRSGSLRPRQF